MVDAYFLFAYNMAIMFNVFTKNPFALIKGAYIIFLDFAGIDSCRKSEIHLSTTISIVFYLIVVTN